MAERREIRELVAELQPDQWQTESLCAGWSVRDVVAHLVAWDEVLVYRTRREHVVALANFAVLYVTSLASMRIINRRLQRRTRDLSPEALGRRFATGDGPELKWLFDGSNAAAHLAEYVIHHEDIRRPLELHRNVPADRLTAALDGALHLPSVRILSWWRLRRVRIEATDIDWARGRGPAMRMTGSDVLMWLAGRRVPA